MSLHSVRFLVTFVVTVTLLSFHPTDVQSMGIPDLVASLAGRRNLESRTDHSDEVDQLKMLSQFIEKARSRKSVTLQGEDDLDEGDHIGGPPSFDVWKRAFFKFSNSGADRNTREENPVKQQQLQDRDYFQAIGLSPGGYEHHKSYPSYHWSNGYGSNDY